MTNIYVFAVIAMDYFVYSALSVLNCENVVVKATVLKAYKLVPVAYGNIFRTMSRRLNESHVEFARKLTTAFNRWCMTSEITTFE